MCVRACVRVCVCVCVCVCECDDLSYCTDDSKVCKRQGHKMTICQKEILFLDRK